MQTDSQASTAVPSTLVLEGALTVHRIGELKENITLALADSDHVVLNLEGGTEVDLSFLQLICAAHKSASRMQKRLLIGGRRPECLRRAMECAGVLPGKGCSEALHEGCLWKGVVR